MRQTVDMAGPNLPPPMPPPPGRPRATTAPVAGGVGRVVSVAITVVGPREVEVRLADGRPGVITRAEFDGELLPVVGDEIEAAVLARDDPAKRVVLSRSWARQQHHWQRIEAAREAGEALTGVVQRQVKGGLVVDLGVRAFLPASMVDEHPVEGDALAAFVGTEVTVVVTDADRATDRVVVSRRDHLRRERRRRERDAFATLAVGKRVTGTIVSVVDYGIHVDLGGVRGMVHRSEMTWQRSERLGAAIAVGREIEVVVLDINKSKRRVGLSVRQLTPDPLASVEVGAVLAATITKVIEYGAFARLNESGVEGLVHMSELSDTPGHRPDQLVTPGDVVQVKVMAVDLTKRRITLSVREALLS